MTTTQPFKRHSQHLLVCPSCPWAEQLKQLFLQEWHQRTLTFEEHWHVVMEGLVLHDGDTIAPAH